MDGRRRRRLFGWAYSEKADLCSFRQLATAFANETNSELPFSHKHKLRFASLALSGQRITARRSIESQLVCTTCFFNDFAISALTQWEQRDVCDSRQSSRQSGSAHLQKLPADIAHTMEVSWAAPNLSSTVKRSLSHPLLRFTLATLDKIDRLHLERAYKQVKADS